MLRRIGVTVAWLLATAALANALAYVATADPLFADLQVYRLGLHHLGHGLYAARSVNNAPFTYPPIAALVLAPLGALSTPIAGAVMTALSLIALVAVARRCLPRASDFALPVLLILALISVPIRNVLYFGQVGLLLMLLVALDLLNATPARVRGALIGVAAAIKLTPFVFVPLLWWTGRKREAIVAASTAVVLSLAAAVALPNASTTYWTDVLWNTNRVGDVNGSRNRSLWGLIGSTHVLLLGLACGATLAIAYIRARRATMAGNNVAALAIVGMASVAVSPISWSHHLVWLVPAEAVLLAAPARFGLLAVVAVLTYRLPVGSPHTFAVMQGIVALLVIVTLPTDVARPVPRSLRDTGRRLVGMAGFEPTTSSSRTRRATKLRHIPLVRR